MGSTGAGAAPAGRAAPRRALAGRCALLVGGSALSTLCYGLTIRASLGLGPLFVVQQGLARQTGMSIGLAVVVTGVACVGLAAALRSWPGPGTLALPFLGGAVLDAVLPALPQVHGVVLRLAIVVLATWCMALGGALVIRAAVGVAPYDAVMLGIHRWTRGPIGTIRLAMELTMLGSGWLLGGSVGVGTAVTGLLIGPAMQFWLRRLRWSVLPAARPAVAT